VKVNLCWCIYLNPTPGLKALFPLTVVHISPLQLQK